MCLMGKESLADSSEEVSPNFVNEASALAEQRLHELFSRAEDLGVEIGTLEHDADYILEEVKRRLPERYSLVAQKLQREGLNADQLSKEALIDRMLGIDGLFLFKGRKFAIDVTAGKSTVVLNKQTKIIEMEELYRHLGIDHAIVLRIKEGITDDLVLDAFSKLEELAVSMPDTFCMVLRYPATDGMDFHEPTLRAVRRAKKNIEAKTDSQKVTQVLDAGIRIV